MRLTVMLRDRPGQLARLTGLVAEMRANVLHILHDRAFSRGRLGETEVELTLETSGRQRDRGGEAAPRRRRLHGGGGHPG